MCQFTAITMTLIIDLFNTMNLDTIVPNPYGLAINLLIAAFLEIEIHYFKCFRKISRPLLLMIHYNLVQILEVYVFDQAKSKC